MKRLLVTLLLLIILSAGSITSVKAWGCVSVLVSSVNPDYPNCVQRETTTCCEGHCTVVTTYDCY